MGLKVAYMSDAAIEKDAQVLRADYARERGMPIEAPETKSLSEAAGLPGCAGVKVRQQIALCRESAGGGG